MAITNLSAQYISQSFQNLVQIDTSNAKIYDGLGAQISTLSVTASNAISSSYSLTAQSASHTLFANTSSYINDLNQNVIVNGNITILGSTTQIGNNIITGSLNVSGTLSMTGPFKQNSAPLTSPLISGSIEYDGSTFYRTADSSGRSLNANHHFYYLPTTIAHTSSFAGTVVDIFSGSLNVFTMQPNSLYEVQYNLFYQKVSTGLITWTLNGGTQTWQNANIQIERTAFAFGNGTSTGSIAPFSLTGVAPIYTNHINAANLQSIALTSGTSDANGSNQKVILKALIQSNAEVASKLKLQFTYAAGSVNVFPGSYYTIKKMPVSSVGIFTE